jgi:sialate O-acetylesterase
MAASFDLGDPDSPHTAIHPRNKQEVGRRLFLAMSNLIYGTHFVSTGPEPTSAKLVSFSGSQWTVRIEFTVADALAKRGTEKCWDCCTVDPFQAFENGQWVNVTSSTVLVGTTSIDVVHTSTTIPTQIRAEWGSYPQCALYNSANIAAFPFIIDVDTFQK